MDQAELVELRETPLLTQFQRRYKNTFRLAKHMKRENWSKHGAPFHYEGRFIVPLQRSQFRSLHLMIQKNGVDHKRHPVIEQGKVKDGLHRIAYYIAMDLPCMVHIVE